MAKTKTPSEGWQNRIVGEGMVAASELVAHPQNWRKHPASQGKLLGGTLDGVGWVQRVIVNRRSGRMLDGHLRAELARQQGSETPVPVVYVDLSEDEERVVLATLDPIAGMAIADEATLAGLVRGIEDADLRSVAGEIAQTLNVDVNGAKGNADAEPQVDRAAELNEKWQVQPGDLWRVGEHRLICGDCTDASVVARVMGGGRVRMVIADPPYGVSIVAANVSVGGGEGPDGMIPFGGAKNKKGFVGGGEGDSLRHGHYAIEEHGKAKRLGGSVGAAKPFGSKNVRGSVGASNIVDVGKYAPIIGDDTIDTAVNASRYYLDLYPDAVQVWFGANYYAHHLDPSPCWVVWDKEMTGNFADCELAWCNQKRPAKLFRHRWNGMVRDSERERRWHPTQKPAALAAWIMTEFGETGDIVLDPFVGAGWTMIAAQNSGRICRAIEMSIDYLPVILERMATAFPGIVIERE